MKRVVVTGLGVLSPLGNGWQTFWKNCVEGVSGIGPVTQFDISRYGCKIGGEVRGFVPEEFLPKKEVRKMDRFLQLGAAAAKMALEDGKLEVTPENANDIGVIIGSGIGGMQTLEAQHKVLLERGPEKVSPFFIPMLIANMASGTVSILHGMKGPNMTIVTACATGAHCIGESVNIIRDGKAKMMVAGGTEGVITPMAFAGFGAMHALSTRNDAPEQASRPFDRDRDGFVMSEGAAILLLEELEHARARGATIYGEIAGYGMSADAYHITSPEPGGAGAVKAMRNAMKDAGVSPEQIDYINAHATSTPVGDRTETQAIKNALGDHAAKVVVSSTKSMTGHMLGAAGAIETIACLLATRDSVVPPTINLDNPDEGCDLDYVPKKARETRVDIALNNSYGFGGQNAVLLIRKAPNGA
ncbi:MAG: beta-ketoacyl-ACP synthase II [Armatimonadetes bacterium]|nr:beta-ketoacyl-ACP synthase II [Armatimonadota bacterium]